MSAKQCLFNKAWLDPKISPEFYEWLNDVADDQGSAYCKVCCKSFKLSNMGKQALVSHAKGPKHVKNFELRKMQPNISFFAKKVKSDETSTATNVSDNMNTTQNTKTVPDPPKTEEIKTFTYKDDDVTTAEILWALEIVFNKMSLNSSDRTTTAMKRMFPDSKIALNFTLGKTKASYVINHGIAPYLRSCLQKEVEDCSFYVISFDESLNKVSQKCQMDMVIRFWNKSTARVDTRYWTSIFLGKSTAIDLLNGFLEGLLNLDRDKLLQVSMDGPNVNLSFIQKLKAELSTEQSKTPLIDIGVCGLHTVNGAVKTGPKQTNWDIYELLRTMYNYFKDSPARRALYTTITGSTEFPQKFTSIRWLENGPCIDRAVKVYDNVLNFVTNASVPESHNKKKLSATMKDPLLKVKLVAARSVISECEPFLRRFQSEKPLSPFLYTALMELLKSLMMKIVKPTKLNEDFLNLDLKLTENLVSTENIQIGFEAKRLLKDAKCTDKDKLLFKHDFRKFVTACIQKMLEKSPVKKSFVRGLTCFDPKIIKHQSEVANKRVDVVLETLHESDKIKGFVADSAKRQYQKLISEAQNTWSQKFEDFDYDKIGVDEFYHSLIGGDKQYVDIWSVMKICFILSHGNASVEGGFSINKSLLVENLLEDSLISQRIIYDALKNIGGPQNFAVTKSLITSVRNSRRRYQENLDKKKEKMSDEQKKIKEKRKIDEQLREVEEKKKKLELQKEKELVELQTLKRALQMKKRNM